jgi:hypothetical protein
MIMPVDAIGESERGRAAYAKGAWGEAFESLSGADRAARLGAGDLELLARAAYMRGRDGDYVGGLERAHHAHLEAQAVAPAVRCAFWIGHNLLFPRRARASEWMVLAREALARSRRAGLRRCLVADRRERVRLRARPRWSWSILATPPLTARWWIQAMRPGIARHTVAVVAIRPPTTEDTMYVVVQHRFKDPQTAFARGERLIKNEGAPTGVRGLQFYPASDGSGASCLWEAESVEHVQGYVDSTLGDSSENLGHEVNAEQAFARQPLGMPEPSAIGA